jgi:membrane glycosyltransferase
MKRNARWARGTLETLPLVFRRGLSAGMRFQLYYSSHLFLSHFVFLCWLISGLLVSVEQSYLVFHQGANLTCGGIVFSGIFLAQFIASTTAQGIRSRLKHLLFTTLMLANNLIYVSLAVITSLVPVKWQPMKKNPGAVLSFKECVISLWPSTTAGFVCFVIGINWAPVWLLFSLPIVTGLTFAIPLAWWSGRLKPESLTLKE